MNPFEAMRKQIERLYDSKCTITNYEEKVDEYGTTTHQPITIAKEQPCKLSYKNSSSGNQTKTVDNIEQTITLIISPTLNIKAGSDVSVTAYDGTVTEFVSSGIPKKYRSHQEIALVSNEVFG